MSTPQIAPRLRQRRRMTEIARDVTYSFAADTRAGKAVIKSIENLTGRPRLLRLAHGYQDDVASGRSLWEVLVERYRIHIEFVGDGLANIPSDGPVLAVANHPYGILDGLALARILSAARGEFKIIAHAVFKRAKDLDEVILPIGFDDTKRTLAQNIQTRKDAMAYLAAGGTVGIFPGGTVSTSAKPWGRAMDPYWKTFTAKLIAKSGAAVVPVYFEGQNSRVFQIASHLHYTLRTALLINEFENRVGAPLRVNIGRPVPPAEIAARAGDARRLMDYLRICTYRLSPQPIDDLSYGLYLG